MDVRVTGLRVEHRRGNDTIGIGEASPRLSWISETERTNWRQAAYEVELSDGNGGRPWPCERIESHESVLVRWPGEPLGSRDRRTVRVRVWGTDGSESAWSDPTTLETGLLDPTDWAAGFVTPAGDGPSSLLRREFDVTGPIERARLYVTALGVYEVELNGSRVGDHILAPGWTSYHHRLRYETYDVTDLLAPGANAIGALLADGWYRGRLGAGTEYRRRVYGDQLALLAQLEVVTPDGIRQVVVTDGSWRASRGPLVRSGIYEGESHDARLAQPGWSEAGCDESSWGKVQVLGDSDQRLSRLMARSGPPVRRIEELQPVAITTSPSGRTIVDFGQNLVGAVRLAVDGPTGTVVTLRHAEVLQDGELCTAPLRGADATDRYTLGGGGPETLEPRFTFHGFRYAEITGWPGDVGPDTVVAVVRHSDMERTGWFECSDERVNQLHRNIVWGMRGNFVDVPTDCPNRDERLGWTGDLQVFAPTASFLYGCAGLVTSWLQDVAADQAASGAVPYVVPNVFNHRVTSSAWGDAATIVPWVLYQCFGDTEVLRRQYASMRAWVEFLVGKASDDRLWNEGFHFGDWLDPNAPATEPINGRTDSHLVANAYMVRSLDIMADTAELLDEPDDAERYRRLAIEVRAAFAHDYLTATGRVASDSQTAYALALEFGLLPTEAQRERAGRRLTELVELAGHKIATGFVGTPLVCDALCTAGNPAAAYRLLLQEECPSWLYPLSQGATTVWERWDGILPDGRVNPDHMNSLNHYAFGAVADWLHRTVGGLAPAEPGYRRLRISPIPGGGLTWARSRHRTPYGMAESAWRIDDGLMALTALVPPNTTAQVVLPFSGRPPIEVGSGEHHWDYDMTQL